MLRTLVLTCALFCAGPLSAQTCPASFRFVDFGLQDQEGNFFRGGPIYRAVDLGNRPLLLNAQTDCRTVPQMATDGHGVPIPVVTGISYDVEQIALGLVELKVAFSENTGVAADENARRHRAWLRRAGADAVRSDKSLCAASADGSEVSCQLVSPYRAPADLIVYCDRDTCRMPVLAASEHIQISATWTMDSAIWQEPATLGQHILSKVQAIHDFLKPFSSGT